MAATLDTLCGVTSAVNGTTIYLMGSGGGSGVTYWLFQDVGGANDSPVGSAVADSNGDALIFQLQALNSTITFWLHDSSNSAIAHRVGSSVTVTFSAGGPTVTYVSAAVLSATPGDTTVSLNWSASVACDSRANFTYTIRRGTTSPPGTNIQTGYTSTSYLDTGRTNGVQLFYRILTPWSILTTSIGTVNSNIVSVTPSAATRREIWGAIAL